MAQPDGSNHSLLNEEWVKRHDAPLIKWKIHPTIPTLMIANFIIGLGFSIAHHFYYASKDGQPAASQETVQRVGLVLAFCFRTFMSLAIGLSYIQCVWALLSRSTLGYSIEEIDSLFEAPSKALSLLSLFSVFKVCRDL